MVIQSNIPAFNTNRILGNNRSKIAKNLEKLSSGYRINRSADDAAGLAISEKMRAQIRGLAQAARNVQDGISLIQTAEGALQEVHSILQRMRELSVQSANDVNMEIDRDALDAEYLELMREIDQIASTTTFNNIKLLDGKMSGRDASLAYFYGSSYGIAATPEPSVPVNWNSIGGKDYSALAAEIYNSIAPQIINQFEDILPSLSDFFTSDIQIGLSYTRSGDFYGLASMGWSLEPDQVSLKITINMDSVDRVWQNGDFKSASARSEFEAMMAHELLHTTMYVTSTVGMTNHEDRYPSWFKEGLAQAMSGDSGWVGHLSASSSDAQIQSLLKYSALTENDPSAHYASGYLAVMYMAWEASGKGAVTGAGLAAGVDTILGELAQGKSLDQVIADNTGYSGLQEFVRYMGMAPETADFVRELRAATGSGKGSILTEDLTATDLVSDADETSTFMKFAIDPDTGTGSAWVTNKYPPGYSPGYGGGAYKSGHPADYNGPDPYSLDPRAGGYGSNLGPLVIQSGANSGDETRIGIESMDSNSIGLLHPYGFLSRSVSSTDLKSRENSSEAIEVVNGAINMVSTQRAKLGAIQNRLEHKLNNLSTSEENLASAESRIRDIDMASEMTAFVRHNILVESAMAMLSQANHQPQTVLSLLQ